MTVSQPSSVNWPRVARHVLTSRCLDLIEENELAPKGLIAYQFSARGHELVQVLMATALTHPHDAATVYYRSRPFVLAAGLTVTETLLGGMAKSGSLSQGRDTGLGYFLPSRGGVTVLPMSGDVGAQYTPAAGWAQAITYRRDVLKEAAWAGAIAVAIGGDGSTATNGFWAALNIATTLKLPMLFCIEDNAYAISVPSHFQNPGANIADNLAAYANLKILQGDGTDPADAAQKITEAVAYVRAGHGPCLLRLSVVRLHGHVFGDKQPYKPADFIAAEEARDPVQRLKAYLPDLDWPALESEIETHIRAAIEHALSQPDPDPAAATRHVLYDNEPQAVGGLLPEVRTGHCAPLPTGTPTPAPSAGVRLNFVQSLNRVFETELTLNPRLLIFGEDVGPRGGVHRVTLDLQSKFGDERVFDTSLSEEGIMGRALGLAYAGLMPAPEIQFRKYADPATEQINDCGWVRWRTNNAFAAPLVLRMPVGYSKKTGDPWHSVTGEAIYAHTLGWRVAFPSNATDAAGLLRAALRGNDPTIFLEHRVLLQDSVVYPYPGDDFVLPFGHANVVQPGDSVTVVTWGAMVERCREAARRWPNEVEVIDLRTIVPWDKDCVLSSVQKTGKCLIVHEDTFTNGFASEISATLAQQAFQYLDAPIQRLTTPDCPVPYNLKLMHTLLPSTEVIAQNIADLLAF